ncbi:hypothetical protein BDK62_10124 [Halomonas alkaliantarctica]|uniref:Uncharacterized protein n=1 Tax=Vreelandella titanicae TaxID=664683 RepID=A0AAP9NNM7_9GAMM|nr:hypothetical protein FX987_02818 [Halomonas titanicae]TDV99875.1 hypothetical protein BDK62_10124 [Halomonas alkaliantarctica]SDJ32885.1 hypothetical protein SAMN04487867_13415 [Halomonas titanicae]
MCFTTADRLTIGIMLGYIVSGLIILRHQFPAALLATVLY